jgi:hypothetical protein
VREEAQIRSLLEDLRHPVAYPAPQPSQVTQVTTHISWVFLTDREVWKLKRPVDYGFVNYTTLAMDGRFSSSRRSATRPPFETGFAAWPPACPSPTPGKPCSNASARSSSP